MPDPARQLTRHAVATLAYRTGKILRDTPPKFGKFRASDSSRSTVEILAHMSDLFDWALTMAKGETHWVDTPPSKLKAEIARFFDSLTVFDAYLASDEPLGCALDALVQGPIVDALTHAGQLAMMRRLAGSALRGENFVRADIRTGVTGEVQAAPVAEFD